MVNSADVKDLLMRLHLEIQGASGKGGAENSPSFASSLGAEIDGSGTGSGLGKTAALPAVPPSQQVAQQMAVDSANLKEAVPLTLNENEPQPRGDEAGQAILPGDGVPSKSAAVESPTVARPDVQGEVKPFLPGEVRLRIEKAMEQVPSKGAGESSKSGNKKTNLDQADAKPVSRKAESGESETATIAPATVPQAVTVDSPMLPVPVANGAFAGTSNQIHVEGKADLSNGRPKAATSSRAVSRTIDLQKAVSAQSAAEGIAQGSDESSSVDGDAGPLHPANLREPVAAAVPHAAGGPVAHTEAMALSLPVVSPALPEANASISSAATHTPALLGGQWAAEDGSNGHSSRSGISAGGDRSLVATPSSLEVGLANGTHGWLKIRAELTDSGSVKAALASSSAAGEQMLHRELPALSNFLEQERLPVSSLVVHAATESSGLFAGMDGGGTAGQQQSYGGDVDRGNQERAAASVSAEAPSSLERLLEPQLSDPLVSTGGLAGGWLSVRA